MGKILSIISRPIKNFNIESRAQKIISSDKLKPAPKYNATLRDIERIKTEYPEAEKELHAKNDVLDNRLKDVYVTSYDPSPTVHDIDGKKSKILPLSRSQVEDFEYGFKEPEKVPKGKVTLRQALKLISDHEEDPSKHSVDALSKEYNLNADTTGNILKYFRMYQVHIPEIKKSPALFAFPRGFRENLIEPQSKEKKNDT